MWRFIESVKIKCGCGENKPAYRAIFDLELKFDLLLGWCL